MNIQQVLKQLMLHLSMTAWGVLVAFFAGVALASALRRSPKAAKTVLSIVDIIQTVPTLAMLTFLMLLFGLSDTTVIAAIVLYALFPITRNTYAGLSKVEKGILRAGKGCGMTPWQVYSRVELPIALPVILSGVKLALISALGIVTTGVLIGGGGLGMLIWRGIQTRNTMMMLSGAVPVSLLAILFDVFLSRLEKRLEKRTD